MLSENVWKAVGTGNPVALAAKSLDFESDIVMLEMLGKNEGLRPEVILGFIVDYQGSLEEQRPRPKIPYFAIPSIEQVFPTPPPVKKSKEVKMAEGPKQPLSNDTDKKKKKIGRRNHASRGR